MSIDHPSIGPAPRHARPEQGWAPGDPQQATPELSGLAPDLDLTGLDGSHDHIDPATDVIPTVLQPPTGDLIDQAPAPQTAPDFTPPPQYGEEIAAPTAPAPRGRFTGRKIVAAVAAVAAIGGGIGAAIGLSGGGGKSASSQTQLEQSPSPSTVSSSGPDPEGGPGSVVVSPSSAPNSSPELVFNTAGHPAHRNSAYPNLNPAYWNFSGPNNQYTPTLLTGATPEAVYEQFSNDWQAVEDISSDDATIQQGIADIYGKVPAELTGPLAKLVNDSINQTFIYRFRSDPAYNPILKRKLISGSIDGKTMTIVESQTDETTGTSYDRISLVKGKVAGSDQESWIVTDDTGLSPDDPSVVNAG